MTVNQVNNLVMKVVARISSTQINLDLVRLYYHHLNTDTAQTQTNIAKRSFLVIQSCIHVSTAWHMQPLLNKDDDSLEKIVL